MCVCWGQGAHSRQREQQSSGTQRPQEVGGSPPRAARLESWGRRRVAGGQLIGQLPTRLVNEDGVFWRAELLGPSSEHLRSLPSLTQSTPGEGKHGWTLSCGEWGAQRALRQMRESIQLKVWTVLGQRPSTDCEIFPVCALSVLGKIPASPSSLSGQGAGEPGPAALGPLMGWSRKETPGPPQGMAKGCQPRPPLTLPPGSRHPASLGL